MKLRFCLVPGTLIVFACVLQQLVKAKKKSCPHFDDPTNGYVVCDHLIGAFCAPVCKTGYIPTELPALSYVCNSMTGRWATYPAGYPLPWPNCVRKSPKSITHMQRSGVPTASDENKSEDPGLESLWRKMLKLTAEYHREKEREKTGQLRTLKSAEQGLSATSVPNLEGIKRYNNWALTAIDSSEASSIKQKIQQIEAEHELEKLKKRKFIALQEGLSQPILEEPPSHVAGSTRTVSSDMSGNAKSTSESSPEFGLANQHANGYEQGYESMAPTPKIHVPSQTQPPIPPPAPPGANNIPSSPVTPTLTPEQVRYYENYYKEMREKWPSYPNPESTQSMPSVSFPSSAQSYQNPPSHGLIGPSAVSSVLVNTFPPNQAPPFIPQPPILSQYLPSGSLPMVGSSQSLDVQVSPDSVGIVGQAVLPGASAPLGSFRSANGGLASPALSQSVQVETFQPGSPPSASTYPQTPPPSSQEIDSLSNQASTSSSAPQGFNGVEQHGDSNTQPPTFSNPQSPFSNPQSVPDSNLQPPSNTNAQVPTGSNSQQQSASNPQPASITNPQPPSVSNTQLPPVSNPQLPPVSSPQQPSVIYPETSSPINLPPSSPSNSQPSSSTMSKQQSVSNAEQQSYKIQEALTSAKIQDQPAPRPSLTPPINSSDEAKPPPSTSFPTEVSSESASSSSNNATGASQIVPPSATQEKTGANTPVATTSTVPAVVVVHNGSTAKNSSLPKPKFFLNPFLEDQEDLENIFEKDMSTRKGGTVFSDPYIKADEIEAKNNEALLHGESLRALLKEQIEESRRVQPQLPGVGVVSYVTVEHGPAVSSVPASSSPSAGSSQAPTTLRAGASKGVKPSFGSKQEESGEVYMDKILNSDERERPPPTSALQDFYKEDTYLSRIEETSPVARNVTITLPPRDTTYPPAPYPNFPFLYENRQEHNEQPGASSAGYQSPSVNNVASSNQGTKELLSSQAVTSNNQINNGGLAGTLVEGNLTLSFDHQAEETSKAAIKSKTHKTPDRSSSLNAKQDRAKAVTENASIIAPPKVADELDGKGEVENFHTENGKKQGRTENGSIGQVIQNTLSQFGAAGEETTRSESGKTSASPSLPIPEARISSTYTSILNAPPRPMPPIFSSYPPTLSTEVKTTPPPPHSPPLPPPYLPPPPPLSPPPSPPSPPPPSPPSPPPSPPPPPPSPPPPPPPPPSPPSSPPSPPPSPPPPPPLSPATASYAAPSPSLSLPMPPSNVASLSMPSSLSPYVGGKGQASGSQSSKEGAEAAAKNEESDLTDKELMGLDIGTLIRQLFKLQRLQRKEKLRKVLGSRVVNAALNDEGSIRREEAAALRGLRNQKSKSEVGLRKHILDKATNLLRTQSKNAMRKVYPLPKFD